MENKVNPIREGFSNITPYLMVPNVAELIAFITTVFDAQILNKFDRGDGSIMHAEAKIGDSMLMMGEPTDEFGAMPASIYLYVDECDTTFEKAVEHGATSIMPPTTMHHAGERYGGVRDSVGNIWWIATHVEDVTAKEEARRIKEMSQN